MAQPVVTTALYFLVFGFALGGRVREVEGVAYIRFIVPGLVMLSLIQNAFLNTASSMFIAKMQGTIIDLLVAPLSVVELVVGVHRRGGAARPDGGRAGVVGGGAVHRISAWRTRCGWWSSRCWSSTTFALLGLAVAIWSDKFEQLNLIPTFVITPLTFLGGVFYSARMLPEPWSTITRFNPVLYMVEGLRYGLLGRGPSPWLGFGVCGSIAVVSLAVVWWMLATGYKLRS